MGVGSRIWHWYQFGSSIPQGRIDERETREEDLKIRRRITLDLAVQDPFDRERLIEAAQLAAVGVFLPAGMRQRHDRLSIFGAGILTMSGGAFLLWLLNGGPISGSSTNDGKPNVLGLSVLGQVELLITLMAVGALWTSRRAVFSTLRQRLHPSPAPESGFDHALVVCAILIGVTVVGLPWAALFATSRYGQWPIGWQILVGGGLVLGIASRRMGNALWQFLDRHARIEYEEPVDQVVWRLHYLAWLLHVYRPKYLKPRVLRQARSRINETARIIELNPVPLRAAHWRERSLRRAIRHDHARVAATLRELSKNVATVHTLEQYDRVCAAVLAGAISAAYGNWDELLEGAPEVSLISRTARTFRRIVPSMVLAGAALVIPILPGVGASADGIRVLLLATAVLSALPTGDAARDIIRGTLDKALIKDSGSGAAKNN
ncbi:hypothetical protein [Streptomyces osmaniensis]|uniref:hypothetical protein n=1 Tax=Streptomyces osmaniensis TaxID=593134 RepID=UPI0031FCE326